MSPKTELLASIDELQSLGANVSFQESWLDTCPEDMVVCLNEIVTDLIDLERKASGKYDC